MMKLTKKQAALYKQRWQRVETMQRKELQSAPLSLKFKQLCLLLDSFPSRKPDVKRYKEVNEVRRRWVALKKKWKNNEY